MATYVDTLAPAPTTEEVVAAYVVPSWSQLSRDPYRGGPTVDREYVPELHWPRSVRTYERMSTDSQLSGLYRGMTYPIRRYVWGIDSNGARDDIVQAVLRDFNLQLIGDAWVAHTTGKGKAVPRSRNAFAFDNHLADALKALRFGHSYFDLYGEIGDDDHWHPLKVSPVAHWTIGQMRQDEFGTLMWIKQLTGNAPMIDASRLVPYIFDKDAGDWHGRSAYRACYREWLLKDRLLRVDLRNHEKGGGVLLPIAPENATTETRKQLGELASAYAAGGGGSLPAGTNPVFIRATGSDVIGSINRHDEAMAREFLQMFQTLGSSSGGNRALGLAFINWFSIAQEAVACWMRDTFNAGVVERYVAWNYGDQDYVPLLAFKRPQDDNPVADLTPLVQNQPGAPGASAMVDREGRLVVDEHGDVVVISATRPGRGGLALDDELREEILDAHQAFETWARPHPRRARAARTASLDTLPGRPFRRQPTENEVSAATDFAQVDANWKAGVAQLVADWQQIRTRQIAELTSAIIATDGDLAKLAAITATAAGGDAIVQRLKDMARTGMQEARAEAGRQGRVAAPADLAALEGELAARAAALEQLLASALSQAAASKAVQLTGGALSAPEVASEVRTYLAGLSDSYLTDQLGGAMSAAQNGGRLAFMAENQPARLYASELLDQNTCEPCAAEDGTEFQTAEEAAAAYPAGGYSGCLGGPRCRGTVVAVYAESSSTDGGTA